MDYLPRNPPKTKYPVLEHELQKRYRGIYQEISNTLDKDYRVLQDQLKRGNLRVQDAIKIQETFFPEIPLKELFQIEERK